METVPISPEMHESYKAAMSWASRTFFRSKYGLPIQDEEFFAGLAAYREAMDVVLDKLRDEATRKRILSTLARSQEVLSGEKP